MTYPEQYDRYLGMVETTLERLLPQTQEACPAQGGIPAHLCEAMRYSLMAGGKRVRPVLLLAACEMLGGALEQALVPAAALEMIHTYSLIHDDLPGMDDDTMRRGRPTNHVVFGVGQAILAGDGLLNAAFELMLKRALEKPELAQRSLRAIYEIATGAGVTGMIAGQVLDLYCEHNAVMDEHALSYIHRDKTACMFIYPLRAAGALAGATQEQIDALGRYGEDFGRVFQATDDLLDVLGDAAEMGKTLGKDAEQGKLTVVSLHGVEGARAQVRMLLERAMTELDSFGSGAQFLRDLIASMVDRTK